MSLPLQKIAAERVREALPGVTVFAGPTLDRVEGSGGSIIEVLDGGPWGQPKNGARLPVLHINILSDVTRDEIGLPLRDDADENAHALWEVIDRLFHDTGRAWADVFSSYRSDGPTIVPIPDGDGSVLLTVRYEIQMD